MTKKLSVSPLGAAVLAILILHDRSGVLPLLLYAAAVHECGHLLAIRLCQLQFQSLKLGVLGAEISHSTGSYRDDLFIAAAGPAASFVLCGCAALLTRLFFDVRIYMLAGLAFLQGVFNILPALPLDGGRMLYALLAPKTGAISARIVLQWTGAAAAGILILCGIWCGLNNGNAFAPCVAGAVLIFCIVKGTEVV